MKEKAKSIATSIHESIKPYEKYLGLLALAVVLDHFVLGDKFTSRFKALAEAVVDKVTSGLDKLVAKLTDAVIEEPEEIQTGAEKETPEGGE